MIVAVVGPTGVGKTKLSVALAKQYDAIIINCDAVQVYKEMNIGSAKVTTEEAQGIKHYLIDIKSPDEYYSVKNFQDDFRKILEENKNKNIVIVGGTGLYLSAAIMDYRFSLEDEVFNYDKYTNEELYDLALKKSPTMNINKNNRVRLERFLNKRDIVQVEPKLLYDVAIIGLTTSRDNLYEIINSRVDKMFQEGLLDEVQELYKKYPDSRVLKTAIGYKEIISFLKNDITLDEAKELIKKNSRHYAKRQYTWFNNKMNVNWFNVNYEDFNKTIDEVLEYIKGATKDE